jgi:hypothetical protein
MLLMFWITFPRGDQCRLRMAVHAARAGLVPPASSLGPRGVAQNPLETSTDVTGGDGPTKAQEPTLASLRAAQRLIR